MEKTLFYVEDIAKSGQVAPVEESSLYCGGELNAGQTPRCVLSAEPTRSQREVLTQEI